MRYEMSMDYTFEKHKAFIKFYQEKLRHYTKKRVLFLLACIAAAAILFIIASATKENNFNIAAAVALIAGGVCFIFSWWIAATQAKRTWTPEKAVNGAIRVKYKFYDDHLMQITSSKNTKAEYRKLKGKYETDDFIYLMASKKKAAIIEKKNCPAELLEFIRTKLCR